MTVLIALSVLAGCSGENGRSSDPGSEGPVLGSLTQQATSCAPITATNTQHVATGRAYTQSVTFLFFTITSYYATGTGESLGSSGDTLSTLYEVSPGVFSLSSAGCTSGSAEPPCLDNPTQVAILGDSYVNWPSHTFPSDLANLAGQTYPLYAVGGFSMGSGGIGLIPPEFDQAIAAHPDIKTVIMDGGGNDILIPDAFQFPQGGSCKNDVNSPNISDCQKIVQKALDAATTLMQHAADKGVRDVVYFFYPHVPEGTLLGGLHPNEILDYALPKVQALCDQAYSMTSGRLTCHFVDMIPVFQGHPEYFALGDIHPNSQGSAAMAQAVWSKMQQDCLAQPASSGCCATAAQTDPELVGCGNANLLQVPTDPATRGPWDVGVRTVTLGRLTAEVLYPAEPGSTTGVPEATYDVRNWLPDDQKTKVPDANSPAVGPMGGHLFRDVPIDGSRGPYPVVIQIHGTASFRIASGSIAVQWASRGFVVVAADYPGLYLRDQLCATGECQLSSHSCATIGTQDIPGDVQTQLTALASPSGGLAFLGGHVDMTRIGITGHSQGACVAAGLSTLSNVHIVMPMDGSLNAVSSSSLDSVLFLGGMNDTVIGYNSALIGNVVCSPVAGQWPAVSSTDAYNNSPGPPAVTKRLVGISGGGHLVTTDLCQKNAQGRNAIQEAQADGVCGINSAVIIGLPALFDCGTIDMPTGIADTSYASTAALEESLMCKDRSSQFASMQTLHPTIGQFLEAK